LTYMLMLNPGYNRVYYEESKRLCLCEFNIALAKVTVACSDVRLEKVSSVCCLAFTAEEKLEAKDITVLSRLSFVYAMFEYSIDASEKITLFPLEKNENYYIDPSITTILKYSGKTNELFTRMILNIALLSSYFEFDGQLSVFDPVCGKGTTLYDALAMGHNAYGIDINDKIVIEAQQFLKKFLEVEKYKHECRILKQSGQKPLYKAVRYTFEIGKDRYEMKTNPHTAEFVSCNSAYADSIFKANMFHIIAGDLPYGVQHGNVAGSGSKGVTRNPRELLETCLPAWHRVLKKGGVLTLSWNSFLIDREEVSAILKKHRFDVLDNEYYNSLEHKVDNAIKRDVVFAVKK